MKLKVAVCVRTIVRSVLLVNLLFLSVVAVAQSAQSTPEGVIKRYFELQVAMTPDNFAGDQAELDRLQTNLIHETMELLCKNGIPLIEDRVKITTLINEGCISFYTNSLSLVINDPAFDEIQVFDSNSDSYITVREWAIRFYEVASKADSYTFSFSSFEHYYSYLTNKLIQYNGEARASYEKYAKMSLMYNSQVGGVNIIDHALFENGTIAIVEAYVSGGSFFEHQQAFTSDDSSQYIVLRKIANKWYIDISNVYRKNDLEGARLERKRLMEKYNAAIAARPKKQESNGPQADVLSTPENFDKFLVRFYKEESFQKERVRFPIGRTYDIMMDAFGPYTSETWQHIAGYGVHKKSDTQRGGEWATDGGYSGGSILFELGDDNKWYLTEYNTY